MKAALILTISITTLAIIAFAKSTARQATFISSYKNALYAEIKVNNAVIEKLISLEEIPQSISATANFGKIKRKKTLFLREHKNGFYIIGEKISSAD